MRNAYIMVGFCFLTFFRSGILRAETGAPDNVSILLDQWTDAARDDWKMPVKIYYPKAGDGPFPVIIVSHGLGGSREGLKYEGEYWAAHGYVSVHLQHVGSDESIWKGTGRAPDLKQMLASMTPAQFKNRCDDVKFALDHLEDVNKDVGSPLKGKLDLEKIAMAGHSFGAITTQAMCGQVYNIGGQEMSFFDPRIKVGIAFSPSSPMRGDPKAAFAKMKIPMFFWTGTKDTVTGAGKAEDRRVPFDSISGIDEFLVIFTGADHMIFNGRVRESAVAHPDDPAWKDLIQRGTTAFLDDYLKGDEKAKQFLTGGEFGGQVKVVGTFEEKVGK